jgi:long-chain acyl-CoA synthetase
MMAVGNVVGMFFETAGRQGSSPCIHYKYEGEWKTLDWYQIADLVRQYARGFAAIGVKEGAPVGIFASTRMEWTLVDLAVLMIGGVVVPIYPNLPEEHVAFILKDSGAETVVVENDVMLERLKKAAGGTGNFKHVIQMEGGAEHADTMSLTSVIERCHECSEEEVDGRMRAVGPDKPASYVYTSGTTGVQKGAVISHGNILAEMVGTHRIFHFSPEEVCLVCLPLAHVLGRMTQFYLLTKGCQSAYAESLDKLAENYAEVRPHFVVGVPRMLEKAYERLHTMVLSQSPLKQKIFGWTERVAAEVAQRLESKRRLGAGLALKRWIAGKLVFGKLIGRLGGRLYCFIVGGASMNRDVAKFFTGAGVRVIEGYGLTETFAAIAANRYDDFQFGTVGKPLHGVDIKLAEDGEVLVRGPLVFKGYLNRPDATDQAFEGEWFRTGDVGELSSKGFLRITDRKKDIIVTAGGKNVAPQRIEGVMMESPYISNVMVIGDKRRFLVALVTLNIEAVKDFALKEGIMYSTPHELLENPRVKALMDDVIAEKNRKLARFETIKRFAILPEEFSTESGEITPTLKIRRRHVTEKYGEIVESLYRD